MTTMERFLGIAEMAEVSGLSQDTLRWYEREGLIPAVERGPDGRRTFGPRVVAMVGLLVKLRHTGMPTADMRDFVRLLDQGSTSHPQRVELLTAHRHRLDEQQRRLDAARAALDTKIDHYQSLIAQGLDCDGAPVNTQEDDR